MAVLASSHVSVYPSARRSSTAPESRFMTEARFVSLVNKLIDSTGFIISNTVATGGTFEFNIYGYHFAVDADDLITMISSASTGQHLIAHITLATTGDVTELVGQDESSNYTGLVLTVENSVPTSTATDKYLGLITKTESSYEICTQSVSKFNVGSLNVTVIDGGTI